MVTFGVVGADHRHIYHLIEGLLRAGAVCAGYVSASFRSRAGTGSLHQA